MVTGNSSFVSYLMAFICKVLYEYPSVKAKHTTLNSLLNAFTGSLTNELLARKSRF